MKLSAPMAADGGSSPLVKPKGDKQVEYLDLDLDPGKATPPKKVSTHMRAHTHTRTNTQTHTYAHTHMYTLIHLSLTWASVLRN